MVVVVVVAVVDDRYRVDGMNGWRIWVLDVPIALFVLGGCWQFGKLGRWW